MTASNERGHNDGTDREVHRLAIHQRRPQRRRHCQPHVSREPDQDWLCERLVELVNQQLQPINLFIDRHDSDAIWGFTSPPLDSETTPASAAAEALGKALVTLRHEFNGSREPFGFTPDDRS